MPELTTPGKFLFGGCGLGAALVALEAAAGRPTVWSTCQYLSFAPTGSVLDLTVTLAAVGNRVTQARAVARIGDAEILTVNAALGMPGGLEPRGCGSAPPEVPPPDDCPPRRLPSFFTLDLRPDRRPAWPRAGPSRRLSAGEWTPGEPDQRPVGPGAGAPRTLGGHARHPR